MYHFTWLRFSVLQAMESWAGPGNEANIGIHRQSTECEQNYYVYSYDFIGSGNN